MEVHPTCVNCGTPVASPFCANCGQKNPPKRLTLLTLYSDFQSRIYGFDGMFPRTLRDLTLHPGKVAQTYIDGNRVKYVGPVGYFFLAITMLILFMEILNVSLYDLSTTNNPFNVGQDKSQEQLQHFTMDFVAKNMRIFSFLLIPITTGFAWLFFRREKLNLLEHSILVFYIWGHLTWLSVVGLFTFKFFQLNLVLVQLILLFILYSVGCVGLYKTTLSRTKRFLKGLLVSFLSYIIYTVAITFAAVAYILSNPELVEMIRGSKQN